MLVVSLPTRFPLRFLIALALGALHAASFVDDATWPLQIAALAGLAALTVRAAREVDGKVGTRRAIVGGARVGFAFGLGWFLVGVSWIYVSLHTYGELAAPLAALAVLAFCAYLALYPALACAAFAWFRHAHDSDAAVDRVASVLVFAAAWAASEIARGWVFTGFPWLAAGYAHVAGPLAGYAPVLGVYGVSLMAAAIAAALAIGARRRPRARGPALTFLLATILGLPLAGELLSHIEWTQPTGRPIAVRLLQGNVSQDIKFLPEHFQSTVDAYLEAIEAKRADLVVLPETAFPVFLGDLPQPIAERLANDARTMSMDIAFGIPTEDPGPRYYNSVLAIGPASDRVADADAKATRDDIAGLPAQRYSKSHIVPFGEFVPDGFHWFMRLVNIPLGDFDRGDVAQQPMSLAGLRVAFNVCYEDLFGEEIIRQAAVANVLVNVSNVAWFGDSMALPQHLDIGRMRAIETGRPMLRATNTGMTASIGPHGVVRAVLKPFTVGSLDVTVQGTTGATPYVRLGNLSVGALIAVLAGIAFHLTRRSRRAQARIR